MSHTIIIPVYNTADYLPTCLDSLVKFKNDLIENQISILAINDGSSDGSLKILERYSKGHPNLISIISQKNQGLSIARNIAIQNLDTNSFSFLDSDDWIDSKQFIKALKLYNEQELELLVYNLDYYDEKRKKTGVRALQPTIYNKTLSGITHLNNGYQPSSVCIMIFNTEFVKENNLYYYPGITSQDVEYTMRFFLKALKVMFIEDEIYHYFRRSGSNSKPTSKDKIERYLGDSIIVAEQIKNNLKYYHDKKSIKVIQRNYNSVVWNLIWRFYNNKKEVSSSFRLDSLKVLKEKDLYPIKGPIKTNFQNLTRFLMNVPFILRTFILK